MTQYRTMLLLPGDGIGPEIFAAMEPLFAWLGRQDGLSLTMTTRLAGYSAWAAEGTTISAETLALAKTADAVLFGAESSEEFMDLPKQDRPAPALFHLRKSLGGFANLRPIKVHPALVTASPLKPKVIAGVDMLVVRELLSGIYFGEPRVLETLPDGSRRALDSMVYTSGEIERIARVGFDMARQRRGKLCSVDKANVLATSSLWRDVVSAIGKAYPDVELSHMYVDNAAMQLVRRPAQFDVILTENMFGDILSDCAAMLGGSIGMLPSASLGEPRADGSTLGFYEPISGTAPDIAGKDLANPVGTVLSLAMALRHSLGAPQLAQQLETAVDAAISAGALTADLGGTLGTKAMAGAIAEHLGA
jgi:3-isopropylmalate dehydrogenase